MSTLFLALFAVPAPAPATGAVEILFVKVAPSARVPGRSPGQARAVVLIHGLSLALLSKEKATRPHLRRWQVADCLLVKTLARDADVYAFAYGQTVACDHVSDTPLLLRHLRALKSAGYRDIVLVGHSAGGLVARHLVEDYPDLGITRVIQVCTPNGGSGLAGLKMARSVQMAFLTSLTHAARERILKDRKGKRIPAGVAFACVVGSSGLAGDGVVSCHSQWSDDLQAQGIPAHALHAVHWDAMTSQRAADLLARLVKEPLHRWDARAVREARKKLLGL
jgi:pimeloyl-ACP methyl ester carboxylesterase